MITRSILIVSDGANHPHLTTAQRNDLLAKARAFKAAGNLVLCVGLRAHGEGFDLLNQLASGGFFLNVFGGPVAVQAAVEKLVCAMSYFCAGDHPPGSLYGCDAPPGAQSQDPEKPWDAEDGEIPPPPAKLPAVVFTPASGSSRAQGLSVNLSVPGHPDATIRYSCDNTATPPDPSFEPPVGKLYEGGNKPVWLPGGTVQSICVKAIARKSGYRDSDVSQACYIRGETIQAQLSGLRWEMPVIHLQNDRLGTCADPADKVAYLTGEAGRTYDITLRFRGIVEQFDQYSGGAQDSNAKGYQSILNDGSNELTEYEAGGVLKVGGTRPSSHAGNCYCLEISDPPQVYWLNNMVFPTRPTPCMRIDFTKVVQVKTGASVKLRAWAGDGMETVNGYYRAGELSCVVYPLVVVDVPPYPLLSRGQFIQMDVTAVDGVAV